MASAAVAVARPKADRLRPDAGYGPRLPELIEEKIIVLSSEEFLREERKIARRRLRQLDTLRRYTEKRRDLIERQFRERTTRLQEKLK